MTSEEIAVGQLWKGKINGLLYDIEEVNIASVTVRIIGNPGGGKRPTDYYPRNVFSEYFVREPRLEEYRDALQAENADLKRQLEEAAIAFHNENVRDLWQLLRPNQYHDPKESIVQEMKGRLAEAENAQAENADLKRQLTTAADNLKRRIDRIGILADMLPLGEINAKFTSQAAELKRLAEAVEALRPTETKEPDPITVEELAIKLAEAEYSPLKWYEISSNSSNTQKMFRNAATRALKILRPAPVDILAGVDAEELAKEMMQVVWGPKETWDNLGNGLKQVLRADAKMALDAFAGILAKKNKPQEAHP